MIYIAVATDLFSDGLMIGAGSAVATNLALVLALGQVLADVPEGFATIATFRDKGVPCQRRLILAAAGAATLWMAIAADMGASLLVICNDLRLLHQNELENQ